MAISTGTPTIWGLKTRDLFLMGFILILLLVSVAYMAWSEVEPVYRQAMLQQVAPSFNPFDIYP